jgi:hypothetical protein
VDADVSTITSTVTVGDHSCGYSSRFTRGSLFIEADSNTSSNQKRGKYTWLQAASYKLQAKKAASGRLQAAGFRLQATSCRLQASGSRLQAASGGLQAASCRLQAVCGKSIAEGNRLKPVTCNLKSNALSLQLDA